MAVCILNTKRSGVCLTASGKCGGDEDTFLDTLDGETDAMDVLGK